MLKYVEGDLFASVKNLPFSEKGGKNIVIAHVVNNQARMGSGFVIPLMKTFPLLRAKYIEWSLAENRLSQTLFLEYGGIHISNMCAQTLSEQRPLNYSSLVHCMEHTASFARVRGYKVYAPLFGAGLAGGDWAFIKELIDDVWGDIDTTIFYLPGQKPAKI